ncbi:DUF3566 domain-containing protein [Streptomyces sp. NPDC046727]|uniref:DUF3566 domain-containing protein n=1 Tax=Streptomyces sp. NPDC046727 TaxID=3155373 RepID=UPI0033FC5195
MSRAKRRPRYTARGQLTQPQDGDSGRTRQPGPAGDPQATPAPTPSAPVVASAAHPVRRSTSAPAGRSGPAGAAARPAPPGGPRTLGPRTIRLRISQADPWSVMVTSFVLLAGLGVTVVGTGGVLWLLLEAMAPDTLPALTTALPIAVVVVTLEVVLGAGLATLGSFLYNLSAQFSGGVEVAVTDAMTGPPPATPQAVLLMARARVRARRYLRAHAPAWLSGALYRLPAAVPGLTAGLRRLPKSPEAPKRPADTDGVPPRTTQSAQSTQSTETALSADGTADDNHQAR